MLCSLLLPALRCRENPSKLLISECFSAGSSLALPAFCKNHPVFAQIAGRDGFAADWILSHAVGLCRWEGRPLWRALRFAIGRAFTPTLQCYLGTVPCILDGFRLFIVQFFGRPAPSDLGGACIVSRSYPRQFTDFLLLRIRMRFPVPSPAAYRAGLFLYECRRCEPN